MEFGEFGSFLLFTTLKAVFISNTIRYNNVVRTPLSDATPSPHSSHAGSLLIHACARSPVDSYINATAHPRKRRASSARWPQACGPDSPVSDSTTEGKKPGVSPQSKSRFINDLGIAIPHVINTLECALPAGWIACTINAVFIMKNAELLFFTSISRLGLRDDTRGDF